MTGAMFSIFILILVLPFHNCESTSNTCDNDKCTQILTSIRMISTLQKNFKNYKNEQENYKTNQDIVIQDLQTKLINSAQESQALAAEVIELEEILEKLNSSGGHPGPKGDNGDQGEKGDPGMKGETGGQGQKGDTGATGLAGDKGETGLKEDAGPTGLKGDAGPTAPTSCDSSPCQNGGLCEVFCGGFNCTCQPWYTGLLCESAQTPSCELVAECDAGVGVVTDLHEETPDTVLVSGTTGISRCSVIGGSGPRIQQPEGTSNVYSTILTDAKELWTIAKNTVRNKRYVYRRETSDMWHGILEDQFTQPHNFNINNNGTVMISDSAENSIKSVKMAPQLSIEATLNLSNVAPSVKFGNFAILPSGEIWVADFNGHCAYKVGRDGGVVTTAGTCTSSGGSGLGDLNSPYSISADMFANILIPEYDNNRISVFSSTGTAITTLCQGELGSPRYVLVTSSGYLFVSVSSNVKIFKYFN